MNKFILIPFFCFLSLSIRAQVNPSDQSIKFIRSSEKLTPLKGVLDLMNTNNSFYPSLQTIEIEDQNEAGRDTTEPPKSDHEPSFFVEDKPAGTGYKTETVEAPYVFSEFNGFSDGAYTPPDDNIAVSTAGYVVSVTNSIYRIFAPNSSTQLKSYDFDGALKSTFPSITGVYYDPRVIYDAESDRFVIVVFNGISSTTSSIVVLFSKTNNPTDGWNAYSFSGDMFSKSEW